MTIVALPAPSPSDADLNAWFAREIEPLTSALLRGARRLTHNQADAEDLVQEALLHAYAGLHTFQEGTRLKAWIFRILYNRWVSTYRAKQSRPAEVAGDDYIERDVAASAETQALDGMPDGDIKAALTALPEGFRMAIYYSDVLGYTFAETAATLNIPHGTAMSRVSRGRKRLRVALAHLARERGLVATTAPEAA